MRILRNHWTKRLAGIVFTTALLTMFQNCGVFKAAPNLKFASQASNQPPVDPGDPAINSGVSRVTQFSCNDPQTRGIAQKNFRRLTKEEIVNTVSDLFGSSIRNAAPVNTALTTFPNETPGDLVKEMVNLHSFNHVSSFNQLAEAISEQVFSSQAEREKVFGTCSSAAAITEDCVRQFLSGAGARIARRQPSAVRQTQLLAMYNTLGAGLNGLKSLLAVLLQSPEFVFHVETGSETPLINNGRLALNDFEVANRIAYGVTGTMPDATLFAAAQAGQVRTLAQVRAQVERLANSANARRQFEVLMDSWLGTGSIQDPHPVLAAKNGFNELGFKAEARREILDYANYMVFDANATLPSLLSRKIGFPKSARMAKIYGSAVSQGQPVDLPNGHGGLLLRASVLVKGSLASSPILRGVAVRKRLLCETLPSPDFSIVNSRNQELDSQDTSKLSNREVVTTITNSSACLGCHSLINPVGFTLEKFDSLGMARNLETVWNEDGSVKTTHPLNTTVNDPRLETGGPASLSGAEDLMTAIAKSSKARACMSGRMFAAARVRPLEAQDNCAAAEIEQNLLNGGSVKSAWIQSIATDDILWRRDNP